MEETKIIYHIDDEDTPYLIKLPIPADRVTLGDFKNALNRPNYKFFFKSMDDDFGVVKEEIIDEETKLPCFNGRVVSWLVPADPSDTQSQCTDSQAGDPSPTGERVGGIGDSRPPSFHANASPRDQDSETCDTCTETDSLAPPRRDKQLPSVHPSHPQKGRSVQPRSYNHHRPPPRVNGHKLDPRQRSHGFDATSSVVSSDLETTSFFDSEDDSRFSTVTDTTSRSSKYGRHRRRRRRHRLPPISRASSISSITDSTMSLNIVTVTLNMDTVNFLGISIVGQSNKGGDGGIYVGSIMKGGAVALDGRIEPGDMILEVNGVSFENKSNDDAVRTLREAVQKPGPITLVVAKCWDPNPKGYFTVPRQEPVRPIDPSAWVAHTEAIRAGSQGSLPAGSYRPGPASLSTLTSASSSLSSSLPDSERFDDLNLTINTDMATIVRAMAQPDSGLEIRDRMWLKITIPNAFIGSDLVDWLHTNVEGFADRRDARKYATNLLKAGYIRHTVNKINFSEQCYYVFGDLLGVPAFDYASSDMMSSNSSSLMPPLVNNLSSLTLEDIDSVSEANTKQDALGPLPPPAWTNTYNTNPYGPSYMPPPPMNYMAPYNYNDSASYVSVPGAGNGAESMHSGSAVRDKTCACIAYHTYKQIRRLWENPDKQNALQQHNGMHPRPAFDDDIDQSTSSSSASGGMRHVKRVLTANDACMELCLPTLWKCPGSNRTAPPSDQPPGKTEEYVGRYTITEPSHVNQAFAPWSTSSSDGSSASGDSQTRGHKEMMLKNEAKVPLGQLAGSGSDSSETGSVVMMQKPLPPPPPPDRGLPPPPVPLAQANQDLGGSRQSFRMAMGNPYADDKLQIMGDL